MVWGKFRILAKLHKPKLGIRPIINCKNHVTEKIRILIDLILKPLLMDSESFLKDSSQLFQIVTSIKIVDKINLYSCDYEAAYTYIELQNAINIIMDIIKDHSIFDMKVLLEIVLYNSIFQHQTKRFRQKKGLAIGSNLGPTVASLVVYKLEKSWMFIHKPLIYKRFLDDIFIASYNEINITLFCKEYKIKHCQRRFSAIP
jgi:hypothetical protein